MALGNSTPKKAMAEDFDKLRRVENRVALLEERAGADESRLDALEQRASTMETRFSMTTAVLLAVQRGQKRVEEAVEALQRDVRALIDRAK